jgi:O-acetyl-ADP-ribose deacetylase (regulator of RNase III)
MNEIANHVANQFLAFVAIGGGIMGAIALYAGHQQRKYAALAEAEREAERGPAPHAP